MPAYALAGDAAQPSDGLALPSLTMTSVPLKLAGVAGAPNSAVPNANSPVTVPPPESASLGASAIGTWAPTLAPVQASPPPVAAATRWALVMSIQFMPETLS